MTSRRPGLRREPYRSLLRARWDYEEGATTKRCEPEPIGVSRLIPPLSQRAQTLPSFELLQTYKVEISESGETNDLLLSA